MRYIHPSVHDPDGEAGIFQEKLINTVTVAPILCVSRLAEIVKPILWDGDIIVFHVREFHQTAKCQRMKEKAMTFLLS